MPLLIRHCLGVGAMVVWMWWIRFCPMVLTFKYRCRTVQKHTPNGIWVSIWVLQIWIRILVSSLSCLHSWLGTPGVKAPGSFITFFSHLFVCLIQNCSCFLFIKIGRRTRCIYRWSQDRWMKHHWCGGVRHCEHCPLSTGPPTLTTAQSAGQGYFLTLTRLGSILLGIMKNKPLLV